MGSVTRGQIHWASHHFFSQDIIQLSPHLLLPLHVRVVEHLISVVLLAPGQFMQTSEEAFHPRPCGKVWAAQSPKMTGLDDLP